MSWDEGALFGMSNKPSNNDEINPSNIPKELVEVDTEEEIGKEIEIKSEEEPKGITGLNKDENTLVNAKPKKKKNTETHLGIKKGSTEGKTIGIIIMVVFWGIVIFAILKSNNF